MTSRPSPPPASELPPLRFDGEWRRYQRLALDAFERDRAAGRQRTNIVAPPGSGKTLLGIEMIRRIGAPAVVLAPNSAVQAQWIAAARRFGADDDVARPDADAHIACLTYQSICQFDDPDDAIAELALQRWCADRAAHAGSDVATVRADAGSWTGPARQRMARQLATIAATIRREIARGEHDELDLQQLVSPGARERLDQLRARGVGTLVLDECHHLASTWGYVVSMAVDLLPGVHAIGLTATPPFDLTGEQERLYRSLLGPVDSFVPTPAVVRDGHLAPFQELAWLVAPLDAERAWLASHETRFRQLVTELHRDAGSELSFPAWVVMRMRVRTLPGARTAELSWSAFQRQRPALARAGIRFLLSAGLDVPPEAPRGEGYRERPGIDDWVELLQDYAINCLARSELPEAAERYEHVAVGLRELGFQLTRRGIRRGRSDVDVLLQHSAAKELALLDVLALEDRERGAALRAVVLCDTELGRAAAATAVVNPLAGSALGVLVSIAGDVRTAALRPLLVTGRGLQCAASDADTLLDALARTAAARDVGGLACEPGDAEGVVRLVATGSRWAPRVFVTAATELLEAGVTQLLAGTRGMLAEGWNAPCVNCLVDLGSAATSVSVQQARGRSLRLDPADPGKIASNWDIVCIAPELARGTGDYERFVRRHEHVFAPSDDGSIEAGPSHVHPLLGPFEPPAEELFAVVNADMARRVRDRMVARERWRIGTPYVGAELASVVVRRDRAGDAGARLSSSAAAPAVAVPGRGHRTLVGGGLVGSAGGVGAAAVLGTVAPLSALLLAPAAAAVTVRRLRAARRSMPALLPIERVARAIADTYVELGELSSRAAASLAIEPRSCGHLRCYLREATPEESARHAAALEAALGHVGDARYVVSRHVDDAAASDLTLLGRLLRGSDVLPVTWHPVPPDLARTRSRADAYGRHFARWLGAGRVVYTRRGEGRELLAEAAAEPSPWLTQQRTIWT